jgi:hypothetical protein
MHIGTSSPSTGAATNADSTPSVVIEENGVAMSYSPTVTNVATGLYRVQIDATAGNGFEAGKRYSVYAVATVGGVTGRDGIAEFEVLTRSLDTVSDRVDAAVSSRVPTSALPANFSSLVIDSSGIVDADLRQWLGTAPNALISGRVDSNTQAMANDVITSAALASSAVTEIVQGIMTYVIAESYRANGSPPTLEQFMSEVLAHLGEADISGTTKTIKRFDHTTTAATFTLNNATAPTAITRTT